MMWHRIAALLGRTRAEAQASIDSAEFSDWCAFYSLEPWGFHADVWRMGVLAATTANFSGHARKALKPADFMPREAPDHQTPAEMRRVIEGMAKDSDG